jgi:hypothetical protein
MNDMNRKLSGLTILTIGLLALAGAARAVEVHVSLAGSDGDAGTAEAPLASLEGARQWIAAHKQVGREPVTVWVHGGTYHLARPFRLGLKDSGTAEAPITCRAVPGDEVVLKGSLPVCWRQPPARSPAGCFAPTSIMRSRWKGDRYEEPMDTRGAGRDNRNDNVGGRQ